MSADSVTAPKQDQGIVCPDCGHDLGHVRKTHERYGGGHHRTTWQCGNPHCPRGEVIVR